MENYPSNSKKNQTERSESKPVEKKVEKTTEKTTEKKVEKVVTGEVTRRKRPLGKRFAETFAGGDAQSVMAYVAQDVLLPAAKDMVADAVSQGIEKMLFGEARVRRSSAPTATRTSYTSYNRYAVKPGNRREEVRPISRRARATHSFDEIVLPSRAEADAVLDNLYSLISEYEMATVADLYDLVGQSGEFTDEEWGWVDLRGSGIRRIKGGYLLDLPRPVHID